MKYLLTFLILLVFYSCQPSDRRVTTETSTITTPVGQPAALVKIEDLTADTITNVSVAKKYMKPNDDFRSRVVSSLLNEKDVEVFNRILTKLDKKNLRVCAVIHELAAIDDKSLAKAKRQFPDPSQQEQFSKLYSSEIKKGYDKYARSISLSMDEIRFLNTAYAFHPPVKSFCGNF